MVFCKKRVSICSYVSVLESYFVPIPKEVEMVVYDTGIEKRGLSILLGDKD